MRPASHAISRRQLLQAGSLALFSGGQALAAPAAAGGKAKSCILVYLLGGPSHIDMWDLKPDAPSEIRGPFKPIGTSVPGIEICEHMPLLARQAQRYSIVRSVTHLNGDHPYMAYYTLTGRVSAVPLGANTVLPPSRADDPHIGSVVAKLRHNRPEVPGYVAIPEVQIRMQQVPVAGGGRAGFLGAGYDPLAINEDPSKPIPDLDLPELVSVQRFDRRQSILAVVDGQPRNSQPRGAREVGRLNPQLSELSAVRQRAGDLVRRGGRDGLFSLDAEPANLRDRYGRHRFGQSLLLARRLVERGVSFAAVHFNHMSRCDGWDTHAKNFEALKGELLPMLDQGLSALLGDLAQRGMLEETLVVVMGEFGRTPRINANAGRDHWGECGSVVLAGGGIQGGRVYGASDAFAEYPVSDPVSPPDIVATIYQALGMRPDSLMRDPYLGREMRLCDGQPLRGLY